MSDKAKAAAKAKAKAPAGGGRRPGGPGGKDKQQSRSGWKLLLMVVVLGLSLVVLPTMVVAAVGMLPTLVAYIVDGRREKYAAFSVGCMNFCGVLPFMLQLWTQEHSFAMAWRIVGDPVSWMVMYAAASVGWIIYYAAPHVVAAYLRFQLDRRINKLREYQKELVTEWGDSITRSVGADPAVDVPTVIAKPADTEPDAEQAKG
jgi:hypothetical protein